MRAGEANGTLKPSVPLIELGKKSGGPYTHMLTYTLTFPYNYFNTSDFTYNSNDGQITILTSGLFRLETELTFNYDDVTGVAPVITQLWLKVNGTAAENALSCLTVWDDGYYSIQLSKTLYLHKGDKIRVSVCMGGVSDAVTCYMGRLRMTYIPLMGWNNNSGGRTINRGIRR